MNDDTIKLLRETNAGVKMAVNSIDKVMDHAKAEKLKETLNKYKDEHTKLGDLTHKRLNQLDEEDKEPSAMGRIMANITTSTKLMLEETDREVAKLMMDGCNMGIQSLGRYINQYEAADEESIGIAKALIKVEFLMMNEMVDFL